MNVDGFGQVTSPFLTGFIEPISEGGFPPAAALAGASGSSSSTTTAPRGTTGTTTTPRTRNPLAPPPAQPRIETRAGSGRLAVTRQAIAVAGRLRGLDDRSKALDGAYKSHAKGAAPMTRRIRRDFQPRACQFGPLDGVTLTPRNYLAELPDLFYLHGGGYSAPPNTTHWWLMAQLAERFGVRIHFMRYPLIPQSTAVDTVASVVHAFLRAAAELGEPPIVAGDSSGGGLSLALALTLRDIGALQPSHLVLFAPWIDLTASTPGFSDCVDRDPMLAQEGIELAAEIYAGSLDRRNPIVSPLFGDPTGLCPTTLVLGTSDALYAEGAAWAEKAEAAGVDVATFTAHGGFHVFPAATWLPESQAAYNYIKARLSTLR